MLLNKAVDRTLLHSSPQYGKGNIEVQDK